MAVRIRLKIYQITVKDMHFVGQLFSLQRYKRAETNKKHFSSSKYYSKASDMQPRYYAMFKNLLEERSNNKKIIECFDKQIPFSTKLLEVMCFLRNAWNPVSSTLIKNSFKQNNFAEEDGTRTDETEIDYVIKEAEKKRNIFFPGI